MLAVSAQVPYVFWILGGDLAPFAGAMSEQELMEVARAVPGTHSPAYALVISPTLAIGVEALITEVRTWLPAGPHPRPAT